MYLIQKYTTYLVQDVQHIWYMTDIGHVRTSGLYEGINSSTNHELRTDSDHGSAGKIALWVTLLFRAASSPLVRWQLYDWNWHKQSVREFNSWWDLGPVCLGCGWLAVQGKLLSRESCCTGKAAVLRLTVWLLGWLSSCMLGNCLKYPQSS
jgi:hypothetical protein